MNWNLRRFSQREEQLKKRLAQLIAQHTLSGVQALSDWVSSIQTQHNRITLFKNHLLNTGGSLAQLAKQSGEDGVSDPVRQERWRRLYCVSMVAMYRF